MRPQVVIEVNPAFCGLQELSERAIRSAFSDRELKLADKALRIAVIRGRARSAHRPLKAFAQERVTSLFRSVLAALIAMPDHARHREGDHLNGGDYQVRTHLIIKGERQDMPRALPERKTPAHFG